MGISRWSVLGLAAGLGLAACTAGAPDGECVGKCDSGESGWKSHLDGHNDPIAAFLRGTTIDSQGKAKLDFDAVLKGIAALHGCAESSIATYIVSDSLISESDPFPRLISTVCSDDPTKASDFFIAASLREEGTDDVDVRSLEMYAWDETAMTYRFYEAEPSGAEKVKLTVDPERCRDCHLAPSDVDGTKMPMTPIMNELTAPWPHWNAEPDFPSHSYEIPEATKNSPHFMADGLAHIGSASRFEQIIRAGHDKVAQARVRERRTRPPELDTALSMLRPLFCAEQVNYASEDFASGLISASTVVSGGMREMFLAVRPTNWAWNWLNDGRLRMPSGAAPLFMVPVRGNADIGYEGRLVAVGTLTPTQVLRVHALDWKRPVFSDFRCGLWKDAGARFAANPPALDSAWRNSDAIAFLFEEIMKVDGVALKPAGADQVIAVDRADGSTGAALAAALAGGLSDCGGDGAGMCAVSLDQFGAMISSWVSGFEQGADGRTRLLQERDSNICRVEQNFQNAPSLPAVSCP